MRRLDPREPLHVDFLRPEHLPLPGRLGLTMAPGSWLGWSLPKGSTLLARDIGTLVDVHGATALVTLQEARELASLPGGDPRAEAVLQGMESLWLSIPDGAAPRTPERALPLVERMVALLGDGRTVVIHCLAGLGRSGTIAACVLARLGTPVETAMARIRQARPGAIQTVEQEEFLLRFAREFGPTD
jgi:hypothetical protein